MWLYHFRRLDHPLQRCRYRFPNECRSNEPMRTEKRAHTFISALRSHLAFTNEIWWRDLADASLAFRWHAINSPFGLHTVDVLYKLTPSRSIIEPPTTYMPNFFDNLDTACGRFCHLLSIQSQLLKMPSAYRKDYGKVERWKGKAFG